MESRILDESLYLALGVMSLPYQSFVQDLKNYPTVKKKANVSKKTGL